jgi:hypothetical protein
MKRLLGFSVITLLISFCIGMAADYSSPYTDPSGTAGATSYGELDALGDIVGTIPSTNPGTNNAWVGMAWANGELIAAKNIYPNTVPSQFVRINPATGAVIATVNFPFNGYVMGITFDGANLWVAQWSPSNVIHCVSLTGAEVSSFVPSTGSYSCRSVNWDGQYLWIGANAGSSNTKLYKMTTTGAIVQEWTTGTQVGWYMGSEFDTNAPAGSQLFVVDNVGNAVRQLTVSGTSVSVLAQFNSPAVAPDVAEGLTFDGDYLWHNGAYASQGVIWKIDDGYPAGPPPNVTISMVPVSPPIVIPAGGGSFNFNATLTNNETGAQTFGVWIMVQLPNQAWYGPVLGPVNLTLPASGSITRQRSQTVPGSAPAGQYLYEGRIGSYPSAVWDFDNFTFTKSALGDGGFVGGWNNDGESFEVGAAAALPADLSLSAYPNPFNPTATIRYSLPAASQVSLQIYDLSGRLAASLVNGWRDAGNHEVTFDGSGLASGVYLAKLSAGDVTSTQKLMLLK